MAVVPVPVIVEPEDSETVHVPDAGKLLKAILPVDVEQVGCVTVPIVGAAGVEGWAFIVTVDVGVEVQPSELVTVKV